MKIALFYLMLLLVGSVSMDQSNQSKDHESSSGEILEALREMTASLTELKCEVKTLKKENAEQATKLASQEAEIKKSLRWLSDKSADLSESAVTLGPFNTFTILAFKYVVTNIGNAYNKETGIFTAPVRGAYHFENVGVSGGSHAVGAVITKNGERTFITYEHQTNGLSSSSNSITLHLKVGDQVSVSIWPETKLFDDENNPSTFSSHLLFTM
uniref:Cerebellin 10 n=1 Tax=Poecilia formosa TaxID=48698 RepID=A0A096MBY2_POEFO